MMSVDQKETMIVEETPMEIEEDPLQAAFDTIESAPNSTTNDYQGLLNSERTDDIAIKIKEQCLYRLAKLLTEAKQFTEVMTLLKGNNEFFGAIPKARTAKIVRNILNIVEDIPDSLDIQVSLSQEVVEWCLAEKRNFLRQRIEAKLASLLLQQKKATEALKLIDTLLSELKKLDDKQMLTEVHLTESRIYHALQNIPKSKASLTASRTAANAIYVVPLLQAEIDEMSGTLHCEESDYVTAYSYFLEAFEAYDQAHKSGPSVTCLKYMILCKILNESAAEVPGLLSSKFGIKHAGIELEAMAAIALSAKTRSLEDFKSAVAKYEGFLKNDELISHHLDILYNKMLESNLLKIIMPFSAVEITHVATLIKLPEDQVIHKLSQMILDHKFQGILDQGRGHLIIYESAQEDLNYSKAVEIITNLEDVVEALMGRAKNMVKSSA